MQRRNFWFAAAWIFMVLVVTAGFWITIRLVDKLNETQDKLAVVTATQQTLIEDFRHQLVPAKTICQAFLLVAPDQEVRDNIVALFREKGVEC